MSQRAVPSLKWLLRATAWYALILFAIGSAVALVEDILEVSFAFEDWEVAPYFAAAAVIWAFAMWKRWSWKVAIPLLVTSLLILCLVEPGAFLRGLGSLFVQTVIWIGLGKLIIESIGRRSVFARSRIRVVETAVPPKGLVEHRSDD